MKQILLTQGRVALVDDADFEVLNKFKWYAARNKKTFYAVRHVPKPNGKQALILMHREILNIPVGKLGDHIDHNGLNNQRVNLRSCTNAENMRNRRGPDADNTSGYRGVSWHKRVGKFRAQIGVDGNVKYLGDFNTAVEAAAAFDAAAKEHFGKFYNDKSIPDRSQGHTNRAGGCRRGAPRSTFGGNHA